MSAAWTLRLNAGDETRIQADNGNGISLAVCDIKCGGLSGRTVAEAEAMAADIVARYNAAPKMLAMLEQIAEGHALHGDILDLLDCVKGGAS